MAVGTEDVDSQAITQESIEPPVVASAPPSDASGNRFLESPSAEGSIPDAVGAVPPSPDWQSPQTQRSRQIGLIVALTACGLIASLLLFGWFVKSWGNKTAKTDPAGDIVTATLPVPDDGDAAETPADPIDAKIETTTADGSADDLKPTIEKTDAVSGMPKDDSAKNDTGAIPTEMVPQSPLINPAGGVGDDPSELATDEASTDTSIGLKDLPPGLAQFTNLIDMANDGGIRKTNLEAPPSMKPAEIEGPAEELIDPMMIAAPPAPINMKRGLSLQMALAPTNEEGYPMADLVLIISQMTGIPIQLDWISFDIANIDLRTPVKPSRGWKDADAILDEVSTAVGATVERDESMIVISPSDATFGEALTSVLDLTDFGNERSSAADVINRFLRTNLIESASVRVMAGPSRPDQQLAVLAVETVRRMRGLPQKLPERRLSRWTQSAEQQPESWSLLSGGKGGPQYDAPITVAEVLRHVARTNNASCIVNWYDARRRRLSPEQLTMPFAAADAGTELAATLSPFGMHVRKVDENHWWVGTEATYDRLPLLIWTQPLGDRRDSFIRQINEIMAGADEDSFRMAIDSDSNRAILLLPRFVVRQLPKIQASIAVKNEKLGQTAKQ